MINVYDFDKTIYNGDSSIDFYIYCLKKYPKIILLLPKQFLVFLLYKLRLKSKAYFKESFFSFLQFIPNIDGTLNDFWNKKIKKIKKWYINLSEQSDVIISASPYFLLNPMKEKLNIKAIIATDVDKDGKLLSNNCYGVEKVKRFKSEFGSVKINNFYSDSKSDLPIAKLAQNAFLVRKNKIKKWVVKNEKNK